MKRSICCSKRKGNRAARQARHAFFVAVGICLDVGFFAYPRENHHFRNNPLTVEGIR